MVAMHARCLQTDRMNIGDVELMFMNMVGWAAGGGTIVEGGRRNPQIGAGALPGHTGAKARAPPCALACSTVIA